MTKQGTIPRGFRNNNPLNIRIGNVWLGEVANPTDQSFEQFVNMKYGLRAGFILLRRYIRHYKRQTIPSVIAAWAPSSENNTAKYVEVVAGLSGISPDAILAYENKAQMVRLVAAMIVVENGRPLEDSLIELAYEMA